MTLKADLDALGNDATTWDGVSEALSGASTSVTGLSLGTGSLSWAAEVTGLTTTYQDYITFVGDKLSGGSTNTADIAAGLREIKRAYESEDESARDRFNGLWEPISG